MDSMIFAWVATVFGAQMTLSEGHRIKFAGCTLITTAGVNVESVVTAGGFAAHPWLG